MDRYTKGFVVASLVYFFLAAVLGIWMGGTDAAGWVRFAHVHFNLLGFMSMMIYGVGYFILPRFNGRTLRWPSWVPIHFYLANIGLIGMVATAPELPSTGFILFSALSVISAGMFAVNLGATMLMEPKAEGRGGTLLRGGSRLHPVSLPQLRRGMPRPRCLPHRRPPRRRSTRTCGWARSSPGGRRRWTSSWGTASPPSRTRSTASR